MIGMLLTNRIVILAVLLLVALFVLPEGIVSKVPYAEVVKNYLGETFSQIFHTLRIWYQKLLIWIAEAANTVRDAFNSAQKSTTTFSKERLSALGDLIDALNRLFNSAEET